MLSCGMLLIECSVRQKNDMSAFLALSTWTFAVVSVVALGLHTYEFPFRNTSLDWDSRVDDLVNRLTVQVGYCM